MSLDHPFHNENPCGNFWGSFDKKVSELFISLNHPSFFPPRFQKASMAFQVFQHLIALFGKLRKDTKRHENSEVLTFFPSFKSVRRSTALCHSCAFPKALITASAPETCKGEKSTRRVTVGRPWKKSSSQF